MEETQPLPKDPLKQSERKILWFSPSSYPPGFRQCLFWAELPEVRRGQGILGNVQRRVREGQEMVLSAHGQWGLNLAEQVQGLRSLKLLRAKQGQGVGG